MKKWADKMRAEAERLKELWLSCPRHNDSQVECELCEPLWYMSEHLLAYAALVEKVAAAVPETAP